VGLIERTGYERNKCVAHSIYVDSAGPFKTCCVIIWESPAAGSVCVHGAGPFKTCCEKVKGVSKLNLAMH